MVIEVIELWFFSFVALLSWVFFLLEGNQKGERNFVPVYPLSTIFPLCTQEDKHMRVHGKTIDIEELSVVGE